MTAAPIARGGYRLKGSRQDTTSASPDEPDYD